MTPDLIVRPRAGRMLRGGAAVLLSCLALTACTGGGSSAPGATGSGDTGSAVLAPQSPPQGWTAVHQGPLTVHVPPTFEEQDAPPSQEGGPGTETFLLLGPADQEGRTPGVTTTVVPDLGRPAAQEADAMEALQRATNGVDEFTREEVAWPGAETAIYLSYEADVTDAEGTTTAYMHEWLYADLTDGTFTLVGAVAPADDYDTLEMHRILASVELPA